MFLETFTTLELVDLAGNQITELPPGAFPHSRGLTHLDVSNNGVTDIGAKAIGQALQTNGSLEHLNVSRNKIGPDGAKQIGKGIAANSTLKQLIATGNKFQAEGAKGVASSMKNNKTIEVFEMEENSIGDDGAPGRPRGTHVRGERSCRKTGARFASQGCRLRARLWRAARGAPAATGQSEGRARRAARAGASPRRWRRTGRSP